MEESIFEQIDERTVSFWVNIAAILFPLATIAIGALIDKLKARRGRGVALGVLVGLIGLVVCLYWHLYDARTSYYDWLYLEKNPGTHVRFFWIGRPTDKARANAEAREQAGDKGVIVVPGTYDPATFWQFVQPYPLYSVRGLGMFALATIIAAAVLGLAAGLALRGINRKWPAPLTPEPQPEAEPDSPEEG